MRNRNKQGNTEEADETEVEKFEEKRGFGVTVETEAQVFESPDDSTINEAGKDEDPGKEKTLDDIFKKYGVEENTAKKATPKQKRAIEAGREPRAEGPFGASSMAKLDDKAQANIDKILITLTFSSLAFCVLCGLAISSSAIEVVFPSYKMDENLDYILKDVLTPAFTPSIGIFFLFSITFGLFKFAQISSQATVYKE